MYLYTQSVVLFHNISFFGMLSKHRAVNLVKQTSQMYREQARVYIYKEVLDLE